MKDETKAMISILVIIIIILSIVILFQYFKFMHEKFQSVVKSYNSGEKLYCQKSTKGEIISKQSGWEIIGERFIKDDLVIDIADCDKNTNRNNN